MKLSVVILNYNVRYFLELCLKSVQAAIKDLEAEIIVIDNNSKDDSCAMVKTQFPDVHLIANKENHGFSKGNNIGVKEAKGEYLCILNPDTVVAEDTFVKLLKFCNDKENLGAVGCKLIDGVGSFLPESKRNVPLVNAAFKKFLGDSEGYYANHLSEDEEGEVDVLVGAFMFMKQDVYNAVGGFDEDYFMYGEDIDLSYKILKAGYQNYYFGKAAIIHFKGESTLKDKNYAKRFYGAMQIFYKKHFKKNLLFDVFVWGGIQLVYFFRKKPVGKLKQVAHYVFISDNKNSALEDALKRDVLLQDKVSNSYEKNTEVILDANFLSYKALIGIMERGVNNKKLTYKILPNDSRFILGSDNAISRGEVVVFK